MGELKGVLDQGTSVAGDRIARDLRYARAPYLARLALRRARRRRAWWQAGGAAAVAGVGLVLGSGVSWGPTPLAPADPSSPEPQVTAHGVPTPTASAGDEQVVGVEATRLLFLLPLQPRFQVKHHRHQLVQLCCNRGLLIQIGLDF